MLALTRAVGEALDLDIDLGHLDTMANDFVARVDRALESSSDLREYVAELEANRDDVSLNPEAGAELLDEIEDFLREQPEG